MELYCLHALQCVAYTPSVETVQYSTVSVKADSNRELAGLHDSSLKLVPSALCPAKGTMLGHTEECVQGSNTVTPTARFSGIITHFSNTVTRGLVALKHSA